VFLKKPLAMEEYVLVEHEGLSGDRSPCDDRFCGKFAGILQVEVRQRMSDIHMLILISCEGSIR
jgi:hypothetical protein